MYPAVNFELSQFIRFAGNVLLTDSWCKTQFEPASLFYNSWLEGESQKVKLLIVNPERWLILLIPVTVNNL
jgi:hypothetical protein